MLLLYNKPPLPRLVLLGRYEDDNADILSATLHDTTGNRKIINAFLDAHTKGGWNATLHATDGGKVKLKIPGCHKVEFEKATDPEILGLWECGAAMTIAAMKEE